MDSGNEDVDWVAHVTEKEQKQEQKKISRRRQHRNTNRTETQEKVQDPIDTDRSEHVQFKVVRLVTHNKVLHIPKVRRSEAKLCSISLPGIANLTRRGIKNYSYPHSQIVDQLPPIEQNSDNQHISTRAFNHVSRATLKSQMWVMGLSFNDDDETSTARRKYLKAMIAKKKILTDDRNYDMYARKKKHSVRRNVGVFHLIHNSTDSKSLDAGLLGNKEEHSVLSYRSAKTLPQLEVHTNDTATVGDNNAE